MWFKVEKVGDNEFVKNLKRIIKGDIIAIIITLILLLIFAVVLTYTSVPESTINPVIIVISAVSILVGSSISTLKIKKKGLINGFFVGLIYILAIYIIASITGTGVMLNIAATIMVVASVLAGMLGGIIGVNL